MKKPYCLKTPITAPPLLALAKMIGLVYDYELMVQHLIKTDNMEYDDAVEFIEYNTIRSLPYVENSPIVCKPLLF